MKNCKREDSGRYRVEGLQLYTVGEYPAQWLSCHVGILGKRAGEGGDGRGLGHLLTLPECVNERQMNPDPGHDHRVAPDVR